MTQHVFAQGSWIVAVRNRMRHRAQRKAGIGVGQRSFKLGHVDAIVEIPTGSGEQFECREGVACRTATTGERSFKDVVADLEPRVGCHPPKVVGEGVAWQQMELQVLGPRPDRVFELLWVGRGEHEHHMGWRFLEHLQQGRRRAGAQHVDLVEDVHLVSARRAERHLVDQAADVVNRVVGRGVKFEDVVAVATLNGETRIALTTRFAVDRIGAIEHFGENASGGGLAGTARTGEQIRLTLAAGAHRFAQRPHDVVLPLEFVEPSGAVTAVERLRGHVRPHYPEGMTVTGGSHWLPLPCGPRPARPSKHHCRSGGHCRRARDGWASECARRQQQPRCIKPC